MQWFIRPFNNERGIALMMTLWVIIFLTVIVTEFHFSTKNLLDIVF